MANITLPPGQTSIAPPAFYSTQPFIAWCLNHYVYGCKHYTWCSRYFFPYRAANPKSSSPYQIFQDLYQPAYDRDQYDSFVRQKRINLRVGVETIVQSTNSSHQFAKFYDTLRDICDRVDVSFFWPVIYVVSEAVVTNSGQRLNSALVGSDEYLVTDLDENDFTLIPPDFKQRSPVADDFVDLIENRKSTADTIDHLIKNRC